MEPPSDNRLDRVIGHGLPVHYDIFDHAVLVSFRGIALRMPGHEGKLVLGDRLEMLKPSFHLLCFAVKKVVLRRSWAEAVPVVSGTDVLFGSVEVNVLD